MAAINKWRGALDCAQVRTKLALLKGCGITNNARGKSMEGISLISTLAIGFGVALVLGFLAEKLKVPALVATCSPVFWFRRRYSALMWI